MIIFIPIETNSSGMKKILGTILILGALALGYLGYTKMQENKAEIKIGELEISAQDGKSRQDAYLFFGLAVVALMAGLVISRK
jgi:hypothetical protein